MQFPDAAGANGRQAALPRRVDARSKLDELRSTCRSQALTINALAEAVSTLRRGAAALKAENPDLRPERERPPSGRRERTRATDPLLGDGRALAVRLPCDAYAPAAARIVVAQALRDRVAADVLDSALLVVSELVTNSVRHSGASPEDAVIVRIGPSPALVRLEVEDAGRRGVIAPRLPDPNGGGGFGLQLVQALSDRWGLERVAAGGTIVWAQLPRTHVSAPATSDEPADAGGRPALISINQRAGGPCATPAGRTP
jgi:anti-sigma regulatory factor (Ser/Thr protein kinase)